MCLPLRHIFCYTEVKCENGTILSGYGWMRKSTDI